MAATTALTDVAATLAKRRRGSLDEQDNEAHISAYLRLNELLEAPDTPARLDAVSAALPMLLATFDADLAAEPDEHITPLCLRTLAYFLYHEHSVARIPDATATVLVGHLFRLLYTTTDQTTYLLALWSLTKQKLDEARHQLVPRLVEVFCQATINTFQSRKVQLYALQGLHETLLKHPAAMMAAATKWCHVVAKCLESRDKSTRDASRRLFQALCHRAPLPPDAATIVATCLRLHGEPMVQEHVKAQRMLEAVHLWGVLTVLLQAELRADERRLDAMLAVPDVALRDPEPPVRILSLQLWRGVVRLWPAPWIFRKPLVVLVLQPLLGSFEAEPLETVVDAAYGTWEAIATAAVANLTAYCADHSYDVVRTLWTRWYDEVVAKALRCLLRHPRPRLVRQAMTFLSHLWRVDDDDDETRRSEPSAPGTESCSVAQTPAPPSLARTPDVALPRTGTIAPLVLFQDALQAVAAAFAVDDGASYALAIWHGFCHRLRAALVLAVDAHDARLRKVYCKLAWGMWSFVLGAATSPTLAWRHRQRLVPALVVEPATMAAMLDAVPTSVASVLHTVEASLRQAGAGPLDWLLAAHTTGLARAAALLFAEAVLQLHAGMGGPGDVNVAVEAAVAVAAVSRVAEWFAPAPTVLAQVATASALTDVQLLWDAASASPSPSANDFEAAPTAAVDALQSLTDDTVSPCLLQPRPPTPPRPMPPSSPPQEMPLPMPSPAPAPTPSPEPTLRSSPAAPPMPSASPELVPLPLPEPAQMLAPSVAARPSMVHPCLAASKEPIASLFQHFPQSFRQLIAFYNIKTIGDLAAMSETRVRSFPMKDPVATVARALDEFSGRTARVNTLANKSPMRKRKAAGTPPRTLTPHRRMQLDMLREVVTPMQLSFDSPRAKVADKVTFHLASPDGRVRLARPGEDSQQLHDLPDEAPPIDTAADDGKATVYSAKLLSHLERCSVYADRIHDRAVAGESSGALAATPALLGDLETAHGALTALSGRLHATAKVLATKAGHPRSVDSWASAASSGL
ncbi:hypothetical protein ACHHYP_11491 [Achlya hypogyna]|uniref:Telomere-associated protein Rif1 N-terminal domain-containing protein n=1 Tax=Achlya hypogyna TaxID=1202772 RepID=A0A1V9YJ31_ACHHY|nr:hypothetical protein ACHHYP_11491 [Achlya hypogyna]